MVSMPAIRPMLTRKRVRLSILLLTVLTSGGKSQAPGELSSRVTLPVELFPFGFKSSFKWPILEVQAVM